MKKLILILLIILPILSFAHPGHGFENGNSIIHYLLSGVHIIPKGLVVFVIILLIKKKHIFKSYANA